MNTNLSRSKRLRSGFTIVELIIVIAVIGILAAILIPNFANIIRKGNMASLKSTVASMNKYLKAEEYDSATPQAPSTFGEVRSLLREGGYNLDNLVPAPLASTVTVYWYHISNELVIVDNEGNILTGANLQGKKLTDYADNMVNILTGTIAPTTSVFYVNGESGELKTNVSLSKPTELAGLAELVNRGVDFTPVTVKLDNDINLSIMDWTPIGTSINVFNGTFDGNNKKINGLTITAMIKNENSHYLVENGIPATDRAWGFIGGLTGTIKNVTFTNVRITASISKSPAAPEKNERRWVSCFTQFGTAVGVAYPGSVIDNVQVGTPSDNSVVIATTEVGGIVGKTAKCQATDERITIQNCRNYAEITSIFSDSPTKSTAGGIIGCIFYSNGTSIINCQNYGAINGATAAGIIGTEKSSLETSTIDIIDCANYGDVNGALYAGGLVAYVQSGTGAPINLTNFLQAGNITVEVSRRTYFGRNTTIPNSETMQAVYYNYTPGTFAIIASAIRGSGAARTFNVSNVTNTGTIKAISHDIRSQLVVGDEFVPGVIVEAIAPTNGELMVPTPNTNGSFVTDEQGTYLTVPAA